MVKIRDVIKGVDFKNIKLHSDPNWQELAELFEIYDLYYSHDNRLKSYFIKIHYCTDSRVGTKAYFLDGEFVCISKQSSRKANELFEFVSNDNAIKVKEYLLSLTDKNGVNNVNILNLDDEISDTYKIEYNIQLLHKNALLHGKKVKIIKTDFNDSINDYDYYSIIIKHEDGNEEKIDCRELDFEYNKL